MPEYGWRWFVLSSELKRWYVMYTHSLFCAILFHPYRYHMQHLFPVTQDRLTVDPEVYTSIRQAISKIHREGGVNSFYAGISPTLMGMIPYSTCYYFMYETMKKSYCGFKNKSSLSRAELLFVGAFSG